MASPSAEPAPGEGSVKALRTAWLAGLARLLGQGAFAADIGTKAAQPCIGGVSDCWAPSGAARRPPAGLHLHIVSL